MEIVEDDRNGGGVDGRRTECSTRNTRPPRPKPTCSRSRFAIEYPVYFTRDLIRSGQSVPAACAVARLEPAKRHRVAVFVDEGVLHACRPTLLTRIARHARSARRCDGDRWRDRGGAGRRGGQEPARLRRARAARTSRRAASTGSRCALAVGGGAVLDAVGFAAAIFHRGVRHIRCPTTVLAQDDSGVGVKNAINAFGIKNLLGTFAPPFAVINDSAFLDTAAGARQTRRHGGGREGGADPRRRILRPGSSARPTRSPASSRTRSTRWCGAAPSCTCARSRTAAIRSRRGSARPLDYGHWSAHKLETLTRHALRHGEAVAIGIALDARYSVLRRPARARARMRACIRLLDAARLPLWDDALDLRDDAGRRRVSSRGSRISRSTSAAS